MHGLSFDPFKPPDPQKRPYPDPFKPSPPNCPGGIHDGTIGSEWT